MKCNFDARGQAIVITGGANGIGRALAIALAKVGGQVIICDIDIDNGSALASEFDLIDFRQLDVANRDEVFIIMKSIEKQYTKVDGLVCGACIQPRVDAHNTEPDLWRRVIDVNLNGVVWCYQSLIPGMIERRQGSILAFYSGLAVSGMPKASAYSATKAALGPFIRSAAKEVAQYNVRVNLISPGVIDTAQFRNANTSLDIRHWQEITGIGQPEDVVGPLMFLLSEQATMTSSILSRDFCFSGADT